MELLFTHTITTVLWLALLFVLVLRAWFFLKPVGGLALCHWFSQAINHFFGEFFISQNVNFTSLDREASQIGYQLSAWAIIGLFMAFFTVIFTEDWETKDHPEKMLGKYDSKIGFSAIVYGLVCYFFLSGLLSFIPSATSILSSGLAIAAGGLAWDYVVTFKTRGSISGLAIASLMFVFPAFTLVLNGFMGYGIAAILGVATVVMVTHKPRWVILILGPIILYFGFSLYPSYMASRANIRDKVWGNAELSDRLEATFGGLLENWQWFDPSDEKQMESLNDRLNQNVLVGYSKEYIESGKGSFAEGDTILSGALALIPRFIWPDKPISAGSAGLVTRFTGIKFGEGTSVGIGNLMEFYVNFGVVGVVVGFYLIGFVVYKFDSLVGKSIDKNIPALFFISFVPGQSLMNSIGSFVEWGPSFFGALCLVWVFNNYVKPPEVVKI